MRDPYTILGVSKGASAAEIKSAFRKLAKKLHPDANKHDAKAASRFAELNAAYEIVGDDDKRKAFDRGEIDAEGKPRFQGFEGAHARRRLRPGRRRLREFHLRRRRLPAPRRRRPRRWRRLRGYAARHVRRPGLARRRRARPHRPVRAGGFRLAGRRRPGHRRHADHHAAGGGQGLQHARASADRQGGRGQDPGRHRRRPADPAQGAGLCRRRAAGPAMSSSPSRSRRIRCSSPTATICGSICRSRSTRRCSAARCACRRSTARSNCRSRRTPIQAAPSASRARACKVKGAKGAGDLFATVRVVLPDKRERRARRSWRRSCATRSLRSAQGFVACPGRSAASLDDALQNRDRPSIGVRNGPGSAAHRFAMHRVRGTQLPLLLRRLVDLLVDRLGHRLEPLAVGRSAHHIADLVVDPGERGELLARS